MKTKLNLPTIKDLRQQGWKIRCSHYRYPTKHSDLTPIKEMKDDEGKYIFQPESLGGKVEIEARDPNGNEFKGEAVCSKTEAFCKARGRNLALARAIGDKATKFNIGDKVYRLGFYRAEKVEITQKSVKFCIDDDGDVCRHEVYWQTSELRPDEYSMLYEPIFATKEELVNSIE